MEIVFHCGTCWAPYSNMSTINRSAGHSAVNQVVRQGRERLAEGLGVIVYPEGTRMLPGLTRKYGISGALLATETGVPVVPRQLRADASAPIAPLGLALGGLLKIAATGRTPFGRGDVKLGVSVLAPLKATPGPVVWVQTVLATVPSGSLAVPVRLTLAPSATCGSTSSNVPSRRSRVRRTSSSPRRWSTSCAMRRRRRPPSSHWHLAVPHLPRRSGRRAVDGAFCRRCQFRDLL